MNLFLILDIASLIKNLILLTSVALEDFFSMYLLNLKNLKSEGLCIDPLSKSLDDFKEILKLNKIKRVKILNAVISDKKNKKRDIYRVSDLHGYYSIIKNVSYADKKNKRKNLQLIHIL